MSIVVQKTFWKTALASSVVLTILIYVFAFLTLVGGNFRDYVSNVIGWSLLLIGITLLVALLSFLRNQRSEAGGLLVGIILGLVLSALVGSVMSLIVVF